MIPSSKDGGLDLLVSCPNQHQMYTFLRNLTTQFYYPLTTTYDPLASLPSYTDASISFHGEWMRG